MRQATTGRFVFSRNHWSSRHIVSVAVTDPPGLLIRTTRPMQHGSAMAASSFSRNTSTGLSPDEYGPVKLVLRRRPSTSIMVTCGPLQDRAASSTGMATIGRSLLLWAMSPKTGPSTLRMALMGCRHPDAVSASSASNTSGIVPPSRVFQRSPPIMLALPDERAIPELLSTRPGFHNQQIWHNHQGFSFRGEGQSSFPGDGEVQR